MPSSSVSNPASPCCDRLLLKETLCEQHLPAAIAKRCCEAQIADSSQPCHQPPKFESLTLEDILDEGIDIQLQC